MVLQKAGQDFLAGIGANIGGGSRRMPELCCITVEVTAQNPIRGFRQVFSSSILQYLHFRHDRIFEKEGIFVGDYRKNQGQMLNPQEDLGLWTLPAPAARLLCRLVIYGKPLEVRLASEMYSKESSIVHRTLIGAYEGKPFKSTKLGMLTNAVLSTHGCPGVHDMRHAREHFSMELMLDVCSVSDRKQTRALEVTLTVMKLLAVWSHIGQEHMQEVAALSSNHSFKTAKQTYAGVFERHSVGGLRQSDCREKLEFSRMFNDVVLGFGVKIESTADNERFISQDYDQQPEHGKVRGS